VILRRDEVWDRGAVHQSLPLYQRQRLYEWQRIALESCPCPAPAIESHLYSNHAFSLSLAERLIDERCLARIEEELTDLEFDGLRALNGEAAALVERAGQAQHEKAAGQRANVDDLRLMGPEVPVPEPSVVFAGLAEGVGLGFNILHPRAHIKSQVAISNPKCGCRWRR
jgi:hypothetical protein